MGHRLMYNFNNPIKAHFFNKKYPAIIQTYPTQIIISIFFIEKVDFFVGVKIPISFGTA